MKLLIGIDGGGTHTDMVLCDTDGTVYKLVKEAGSNPNDIGFAEAVKVVERGIGKLLQGYDKKDIVSLFAGLSGGMTGNYIEEFQRELRRIMGEDTRIRNHSDIVNALSGGLEDKDGCVVISGTGVIGFARRGNEQLRVSGYGYLLDKGGSGFDLGRDALFHALCQKDGRGAPTVLTKLIEEKTDDLIGEIGNIYKQGKPYIASFAPLVFQAYRMGDAVAQSIVEQNAAELAKICNALGEFVGGSECSAVLTGSVFKEFELLKKYLLPQLHRQFNFIFPDLPPVYGSVVEAARQIAIAVDPSFKSNFKGTMPEVGK